MAFHRHFRRPRRLLPTSQGPLPPLPWSPDFDPQAFLHTRALWGARSPADPWRPGSLPQLDRPPHLPLATPRPDQARHVFAAMATHWQLDGAQVSCELSPCDPHHVLGLCLPVTGPLSRVDADPIDEVVGLAIVLECAEGYRLESFVQTEAPRCWRTSQWSRLW